MYAVFWLFGLFFFFSSRRRHTRSLCDWSSDVCSSDLSTPRRRSPGAALLLQEPGGAVPAAATARDSLIQAGIGRGAQGGEAALRERQQGGWKRRIGLSLSGRRDLRNHLPPIGHQHTFTSAHLSEVLAQAVLELSNAHGFHDLNVAS